MSPSALATKHCSTTGSVAMAEAPRSAACLEVGTVLQPRMGLPLDVAASSMIALAAAR